MGQKFCSTVFYFMMLRRERYKFAICNVYGYDNGTLFLENNFIKKFVPRYFPK